MSIFDIDNGQSSYFDSSSDDTNNRKILDKVSEKSYLPTLRTLIKMMDDDPDFKVSMSISGVLIEQLQHWRPDVLELFTQLIKGNDRVELIAETYNHSLAFLKDLMEFDAQVDLQHQTFSQVFGKNPQVFRGTELMYSNGLATWAEAKGYKAILSEGVDDILGERSPNHLYRSMAPGSMPVLLKNYQLSDDIAFRFSDKSWNGWPLDVHKFRSWVDAIPAEEELINLFIDFETFGEHQWDDTGVFDFLRALPGAMSQSGIDFVTPSGAVAKLEPRGTFDCPDIRTWADAERDLTAWLGNDMQVQAFEYIYALADMVRAVNDPLITHTWRRLQTSDNVYYMCTKWFSDGDVHAYFSPYSSPYDAFIYFMNTLRDFELQLIKRCS